MCELPISNTVSHLQIIGRQMIISNQKKVFYCLNEMTKLSFNLANNSAISFLIGNACSPIKTERHQLFNQKRNIGV